MIQNLPAPTGACCESRAVRIRGRRRGRPSKLIALTRDTPELYRRMLAYIRAGAFTYVAAQFVGVAPETFSRWMGKGASARGRRIYRQFRQDVLQAAAHARVSAEIRVHDEDPLCWLRLGPGRSTPGRPGWTELRRAAPADLADDPGPPPSAPVPGQGDLGAALRLLERLGFAILPAGRAVLDVPQGGGVEA